MKKIIASVLTIATLASFAAMAMGSGSSSSDDKKDIVTSDASVVAGDNGEAATTTAGSSIPTIEEQVIVDRDGLKITAKEYVTDSIWGEGIKLLIENTSDADYTVGCDALIVNDYMITDLFVSEIAAGKSANETMYLSSTELNAAGIETVGRVEMYFHAYDDDYDMVFQNEYSEIKTSEYGNMDTTPNDEGVELYNENGIRIVGKTVDENSFWGTAILLYIENNSGTNVGISVDDMSINGFMMTPYFSTTVYDGRKAIDDITILSSEIEENDIDSIDEVELKFHIYNADSYSTIADSDPITFSAK